MQRKELHAILDEDFISFLQQNSLYDSFSKGEIICGFCGDTITLENIYAIFYTDGYRFCCDKFGCAASFQSR